MIEQIANISRHKYFEYTYALMAIAILFSAFTAYVARAWTITKMASFMSAPALQSGDAKMLMFILVIAYIAIPCIGIMTAVKHPALGLFMLIMFSGLTGVIISPILVVYSGASVISAFISSSLIFILMALFGQTTKINLQRMGTICMVMLIVIIISSLVNVFLLHNSPIEIFIDIVSIIIFSGLAAWDTQFMNKVYDQAGGQSLTGIIIAGALNMYTDWLNIFLNLLELFGDMSQR